MSDIIGLLGILVAFFIVIYFTYKGFHLAYVVMVACLVVLVTNNMPLIQTFNETIMPKVGEQAATLLPLYLFGPFSVPVPAGTSGQGRKASDQTDLWIYLRGIHEHGVQLCRR